MEGARVLANVRAVRVADTVTLLSDLELVLPDPADIYNVDQVHPCVGTGREAKAEFLYSSSFL